MCSLAVKYPHADILGRVPVETVQKWLWELYHKCGSWGNVELTTGLNHNGLYRWIGHDGKSKTKAISKRNAQKIVQSLVDIRSGKLEIKRHKKTCRKVFKYGCSGCGCELSQFTPGCKQCWARKHGRERRKVANQ